MRHPAFALPPTLTSFLSTRPSTWENIVALRHALPQSTTAVCHVAPLCRSRSECRNNLPPLKDASSLPPSPTPELVLLVRCEELDALYLDVAVWATSLTFSATSPQAIFISSAKDEDKPRLNIFFEAPGSRPRPRLTLDFVESALLSGWVELTACVHDPPAPRYRRVLRLLTWHLSDTRPVDVLYKARTLRLSAARCNKHHVVPLQRPHKAVRSWAQRYQFGARIGRANTSLQLYDFGVEVEVRDSSGSMACVVRIVARSRDVVISVEGRRSMFAKPVVDSLRKFAMTWPL